MYVRTYGVYLSICVKFCVRDLHIMLLGSAEFGENRRIGGWADMKLFLRV